MKNYNATNLLQKNKYKKCTKHHYYWFENFSYITKYCYYWFENFTYTTHYYWFEYFTYYMRTFYKYKLKANTCTISPNYNTPVCAHNPTSKASAKNTNTTQSTTTITETNNKSVKRNTSSYFTSHNKLSLFFCNVIQQPQTHVITLFIHILSQSRRHHIHYKLTHQYLTTYLISNCSNNWLCRYRLLWYTETK